MSDLDVLKNNPDWEKARRTPKSAYAENQRKLRYAIYVDGVLYNLTRDWDHHLWMRKSATQDFPKATHEYKVYNDNQEPDQNV